MPEERIWYLWTGEGQKGPYAVSEILGWKSAGHITDEWHVWRDGLSIWQKIGETPELSASPVIFPVSAQAELTEKEKKVMYCPACSAESEDLIKCTQCGIIFNEWGRKKIEVSSDVIDMDKPVDITKFISKEKANFLGQAVANEHFPFEVMTGRVSGSQGQGLLGMALSEGMDSATGGKMNRSIIFRVPMRYAAQAYMIMALYEKDVKRMDKLADVPLSKRLETLKDSMVNAATLHGWKIWDVPGSIDWLKTKAGLDDAQMKKLVEESRKLFASKQKRSSIGSAVLGVILLITGIVLAVMSSGNENLLIWGAVCGGASLIFLIFAFISRNKLNAIQQT